MTTEYFPLPTSYKMGKAVGRIIHAVADTPEDEDALPQAKPASGKVTFTPQEKQRKVTDENYPAIAMHEQFVSTLNTSGRITDSEGRNGIWLLEGIWRVDFALDAGSIESFDIQITPEHDDENPLDIATAVPYTPPAGAMVHTMLVPSGGRFGMTLTLDPAGDLMWIEIPSMEFDWADMTDVFTKSNGA